MFLTTLFIYAVTSYTRVYTTPVPLSSTRIGTRDLIPPFPPLPETLNSSPSNCPNLRTTWSIVWSCLATIFACTWVAVHPNSAGKCDKNQRMLLRRVELMIWSILTPEMIIYWAIRQWMGARHLAVKYKGYGWTVTHGHFLQMGGFMLVDEDGSDVHILTPSRFRELLHEGTIRFPKITAEEINALGKGDAFSKLIVVTQTLWFIAQCISRAVQGLDITEIELVTVAFAFLNGAMYFLWWDKPLDANFVVRIQMCSTKEPFDISFRTGREPYNSINEDETTNLVSTAESEDLWQSLYSHGKEFDETQDIELQETLSTVKKNPPRDISTNLKNGRVQDFRPLIGLWPRNEFQLEGASVAAQKLVAVAECSRTLDNIHPNTDLENQETGPEITERESVEVISDSIPHQFAAITDFEAYIPENLPDSHSSPSEPIFTHFSRTLIWKRMDNMRGFRGQDVNSSAMRVPTFFALGGYGASGLQRARDMGTTAALIGLCIGAIHCGGWNFVFPSIAETMIWRISSCVICVIPFYYLVTVPPAHHFVLYSRTQIPDQFSSKPVVQRVVRMIKFLWVGFVMLIPIYLAARIILLVEAVIALRALPVGAYVELEWNKFIPHI